MAKIEQKMTTQTKTTWRKAKLRLPIFVAVILLVYFGFFKYGIGSAFWNILNKNTGAIQAVSTIVLVGITAFYAMQVRKTNELISMQIFPNIFIKPDKLYSSFLEYEFITKVKENILKSDSCKTGYNFNFKLNYGVSNHSASSGSVGRPQLLIENPQNGKKKLLSFDTREVVIDYSNRGEIKNTLYLRAGETKNMEEEFGFFVSCSEPSNDDLDFINNASSLRYTILYKNVVGNQFSIPLTKDDVLPFHEK